MASAPLTSFFLVWSAVIVGLVSVGPLTDGGAHSPLTAGLFLPLAFAALSYPLASMLAVGAMVVGAYLAIALGMGGVGTPEVCFMSMALACATWMVALGPADRVPEPPRLTSTDTPSATSCCAGSWRR